MNASNRFTILSAPSVEEPLEEVLSAYGKQSGIGVEVTFEPTAVIEQQISEGSLPAIVICAAPTMARLVDRSVIAPSSVRALVESSIGVAVAAGSPHPDISTVARLVDAILSADTVAYLRNGASGQHFADLLERLGISDEIGDRAVLIETGPVAHALLDGRAAIAIQQLSELAVVDGVEIVGPLPEGAQKRTTLSIGIAEDLSTHPEVQRLHEFITSSESRERFLSAGLEAPSSGRS